MKAMSCGIEPATLRRKTFSGQGLELVVSLLLYGREICKIFTKGLHKLLLCIRYHVTYCMHSLMCYLQDHNGHRFFTEQFKVATVCEYCNDPIPLLERGEVCIGKTLPLLLC